MYRLPTHGELCSLNVEKTLLNYILPEPLSSMTEKDSQPKNKQTKAKSKKLKKKRPIRRRRKLSNVSSSESESEEDGIASDVSSSDDSFVCDFKENLSDREASVDLLESLSDSSDKETVQSTCNINSSPFQKGRKQIVLAANFSTSQTVEVKETTQLKSGITNERNVEELCKAVHKVFDLLVQEDCLVMMKVFSDWLQTYPAVIATCAQVMTIIASSSYYCIVIIVIFITQSVPQLWSHLAQLLNILPTEAQLLSIGKCLWYAVIRNHMS